MPRPAPVNDTDDRSMSHADAALQDSEALRLGVLAAAPDAIVMIDERGIVVEWNPAAERTFGYARGEAIGLDMAVLIIPPDLREAHRRGMERVIAGGEGRVIGSRVEMPAMRRDGSVFPSELTITAITVGGALLFAGFLRDITERRQREYDLEQSEERFRTIVESASDYAIITLDRHGLVTSWNPGAANMLGYSESEAIGRHFRMIFTDEDNAVQRPELEMERTLIDQRAEDERWHRRKDGSLFWASGLTMALHYPSGMVRGYLKIIRDETPRRLAEEERNHLLASERYARAEAERANRSKDEFMLTLSHELRTPLNAILGWSQLLASADLGADELHKAFATIERNARLQARLIDDLLELSRITSGKVTLRLQRIDLCSLVDSTVESMRPVADERGIELATSYADDDAVIEGDPGRLQQIVMNLLSNALKFTARGGRVDVSLARLPHAVRLEVSDTGKGISQSFLPHIFERFRQEDATTTRRHGGLGIGLSIVRTLVHMHAGTISAHSDGEDRGTTFRMTFPLAGESIVAQTAERPAPTSDVQAIDLSGVRVLVVEDDADARALVRKLLEQLGAQVVAVASAREGIRKIDEDVFDVLLSDISMPEEDGLQFIRRVRQRSPEAGGTVPAIALTAFARAEDRHAALVAGFQHHVSKPIEVTELVAIVASVAGRLAP